MRRALRFSVLTVCPAFCLTGCSAAIGASASQSGPQRYEATWMDVFDTVTTVVGYADSEEEFEARAQEFHDEMVEYHQLYDIYNDYEGVSNIKTINDNAGVAPVEVDERIIDLLVFARDMCEATDGKTNAAMGSVTKLWHDARAAAESDANLEGTPPSEDEIAEALTHISFDTIVIDEAASTVFITDPAQSIDVGSIAKGYAVEQAASQFDDLLISAGGNVRAAGTKPDGSLWAVGVQNPDGGSEYMPVGIYYQAAGGWTTGDNGITMQWDLVDIVGLIADREYIPPATLPTTLEGWVASIVAQLGTNFAGLYTVDSNYAQTALTCALEDVQGKTCGDILRWACQATGTFPRADSETGKLAVEPFWSQGNQLTLDNLVSYPIMRANGDVGALIFTLNDGSDTQYVVSGTSAASSETLTIQNPFIKTQAQALTAAKLILATYGGNQLETTGRGDPSSEIGDVDTVWLDESQATTGRLQSQTLQFVNGVLANCQSVLLQADGSFLFESMAVITESGSWTAPEGVTRLRVIIGQGGQGSGRGQDGQWVSAGSSNISFSGYRSEPGAQGVNGQGGKIWYGTIDINPQQVFQVTIGQGGAAGATYGQAGNEGGETTFGPYSSANGEVYSLGFSDVASGSSYGRTGVQAPSVGSSDGARGGEGGTPGAGYLEWVPGLVSGGHYEWVVTLEPGPGQPGKAGASGFVVVYWDKAEEAN